MTGHVQDVDRWSLRLACLSLPTRRRLLRAGWKTRSLIKGSTRAGFADRLEWALRLPRRDALRIDRELVFQDQLTALEWLALFIEDMDQVRADCRCLSATRGQEDLARVAESGRPVILAPLHMGNYVHCIAWTMLSFFADRPMMVLYKRNDLHLQSRTIGRIRQLGIPLRMVQVDDRKAFLPAVRAVKQDAAVVIAFADLPPAYGSPAEVNLFQRPMRMAVGVDALARLTGGFVVPMASETLLSGDRLHFGRPFESEGSGADERARVVEIMRSHLETAVLDRPEQWHLWGRLQEYDRDEPAAHLTTSSPVEAAA